MKSVLFAISATLLLGCAIALAGLGIRQNANDPAIAEAPMAAPVKMTYRKLANGTIVYEETPGEGTLQEIAPAAGETGSSSKEPTFRYDPLTQTYRAYKNGGGQDIIRDPLNPTKE